VLLAGGDGAFVADEAHDFSRMAVLTESRNVGFS
jgi:hypothetical protein